MRKLIYVFLFVSVCLSADKYVRSTGGSDANDGLSFANGWASLQYAFDNLSAGDNLYVCSDATNKFTVTAQVDIDVTSGTATAKVNVIGADLTDGTPHSMGTYAHITTASSITALFSIALGIHNYTVKGLLLDGGGSGNATYCLQTATTGDADRWVFDNCRFTKASSHNLYVYVRPQVDSPWTLSCCIIDSAGRGGSGNGVKAITSGRSCINYFNCQIFYNADIGVEFGISATVSAAFIGNVVYANGGDGLFIDGNSLSAAIVASNVFHNNGGDGLQADSEISFLKNNSFSDNGAYGVAITDNDFLPFADYNAYYNNTSGAMDTGTPPGNNNVTSDPLYTSTTAGAEDFTLQAGSPLLNAGVGYEGN